MSFAASPAERSIWTWERWKATAWLLTTYAPASACPLPVEAGSCAGAQDFPNLTIDAGAVPRRIFHQARPLLGVLLQLHLRQQIGGLQDGFHRVGEIVRQDAQLAIDLRGNLRHGFLFWSGTHVCFPASQFFSMPTLILPLV